MFRPRLLGAGGGLNCVTSHPKICRQLLCTRTVHCVLCDTHRLWLCMLLGSLACLQLTTKCRCARFTCTHFPLCGGTHTLALHAACKGCLPSTVYCRPLALRFHVFRSDGNPQGPAAPCKQRGWHLIPSTTATPGAACQPTSIGRSPRICTRALRTGARAGPRARLSTRWCPAQSPRCLSWLPPPAGPAPRSPA